MSEKPSALAAARGIERQFHDLFTHLREGVRKP
jgi:hypothetical protein